VRREYQPPPGNAICPHCRQAIHVVLESETGADRFTLTAQGLAALAETTHPSA
jgi:hypothetical protein